MDLFAVIEKKRPNLKKSSIMNYIRNVQKLNGNQEIKNLDFLDDPDKLIEKLKTDKNRVTKDTTIRNYLTSALVVLDALEKDSNQELIKKYQKILKDYAEKINTKYISNEKTEKESKNWLTFDELKEIQKEYEKKINEMELNKKNHITPKNNKILLYYLISSLYTLHAPLRLDWANMHYTKNKKDTEDKSKNWFFDKGTYSKIVYLNDYKTQKKFGNIEFKLNKELSKIINLYLKFNNNSKFFLLNSRGFRMSQNSLSKMIPQVFKKGDKTINLNMIRKAKTSSVIDVEQMKKEKELAKDMLHSQSTQQMVYAKKE